MTKVRAICGVCSRISVTTVLHTELPKQTMLYSVLSSIQKNKENNATRKKLHKG